MDSEERLDDSSDDLIQSMSHTVNIAHPLIAKVKTRIERPLAMAVKGENLQKEMLP